MPFLGVAFLLMTLSKAGIIFLDTGMKLLAMSCRRLSENYRGVSDSVLCNSFK